MNSLQQLFSENRQVPVMALAPMQDITDLPFMNLIEQYGGPDLWYTEYFRVHSTSSLDRSILRSIVENRSGKPIVAQMIGNDIPAMIQTAKRLETYPVAAIDLNLGCPAPVVYRKCAGGGLLGDPARVDRILGGLRESIEGKFTVKTRIGFENTDYFDELLEIFDRNQIDLLTVHGRTVSEGYRSEVHYEFIEQAVDRLKCPVLANGNVYSVKQARKVIDQTKAAGLMIGRGAIRNPWVFRQIREAFLGIPIYVPTGRDVLVYIRKLFDSVRPPGMSDVDHVRKMKRYINFIGAGIEPTGAFLYAIRRVESVAAFFSVCGDYLDHSEPMELTPSQTVNGLIRGVVGNG